MICTLMLAMLLAGSLPAWAETINGRVVGVSDGDTITVLDAESNRHKIRMAGIDAPEKNQPYGQKSKANLAAMLFDKDVRIEWSKRDRYKRIVGKVWVRPADCATCDKTLDAGLAQVTVGLAWWYRKYSSEQTAEDRERYAFAETEAKARKAGLWQDSLAMPPWEWRRQM